MAEKVCHRLLDYSVKLVSYRRSFSLGFCVLNFVFSLVATLGNLLVIRALMKNSSIPATVKKLFLSLAFSDLAVVLLPQLMTAIISAVMLKMACSDNSGVCSYLQSCQISSESDIRSKSASKCPNKRGTQTKKIRL